MEKVGVRVMRLIPLFLVFLAGRAAAGEIRILDRFVRPAQAPRGLSGLTQVEGNSYFAVDDRGGRLCRLTIALDGKGRVSSFATNACVRLKGRADLEGCAWDPLEKRIWVSDESDASIRQFDPVSGAETAVAPVPEIYRRESVPNRSLEALAISPDGLKLYAANEDTLRCDGSVATTNAGGVVRIQEFVRTGAGAPWTPSRSFRYRTHRLHGGLSPQFRGLSPQFLNGVAALAVDTDGSLLVLEREFSQKSSFPFPTFNIRLVRVSLKRGLSPEKTGSVPNELSRKTLLNLDTGFANYEGLSRGPRLPDGTQTWLLVSDAGGGAEASILILGSHEDK